MEADILQSFIDWLRRGLGLDRGVMWPPEASSTLEPRRPYLAYTRPS